MAVEGRGGEGAEGSEGEGGERGRGVTPPKYVSMITPAHSAHTAQHIELKNPQPPHTLLPPIL